MRRTLPLIALFVCGCFGTDPYRRLAEDLASPLGKGDRKIAVLPFRDLETHDSNAGLKVAEALTTRLYRRKGLQLVERAMLDKVLDEHRVEGSGAFDEASLQRLGRLAGADAVVVGTLTGIDAKDAEVNARVVEMGTGRMLSAARARIPRPLPGSPAPRAAADVPGTPYPRPSPPSPAPEGTSRRSRVRQASGGDFLDGTWNGLGTEVGAEGVLLARGAGSVSAVEETTPLPSPRKTNGLAAWKGRIYSAGGESDGGNASASVWSAPVREDGSLGEWRPETPLPSPRYQAPLAAWDGRLYLFGGYGGGYRDDVLVSSVGDDGRLGEWTVSSRLPAPVTYGHVAFWAGRAFLAGGVNVGGNIPAIFFSDVRPDGSFGEWERVEVGPLRGGLTPALWQDRLYGVGANMDIDAAKTVLWMPLTGPHALSLRSARRKLPIPLLGQGLSVVNGRLFTLGGQILRLAHPDQFTDAILSAGLSEDGEPGVWTREPVRLPGKRTDFFAPPLWKGSIYVIGGAEDKRASTRAVRVRISERDAFVGAGAYFGSLSLPSARSCRLSWKGDENGGRLRISVRTAGETGYSSWRAVENGQPLGTVRFVEYRADLEASPEGRSPLLREIGLQAE